jgi:hypothetical protein
VRFPAHGAGNLSDHHLFLKEFQLFLFSTERDKVIQAANPEWDKKKVGEEQK